MNKTLAGILAASLVHRLLFLGRRQLWTGELMQALVARAASAGDILRGLKEGMHVPAPLDYFVQRPFVWFLGESEWSLRLHAAIFGTLAIWVFYRIAEFLFGRRTALYCAFLFAFYPLQYHYSQEGRPWALFLLLTLLSYDLLLRWAGGKNAGWKGGLLLCAVLVLLPYQSFMGLLVLAAQLAGLVGLMLWGNKGAGEARAVPEGERESDLPVLQWRQVALFALAALAAVLAFAPWIQYAWSRPLMARASEVADPRLLLRLVRELGDQSYAVAGWILIGAGAGVRAMLRHGQRRTLLFLTIWFLPSIPAILILEYWSGYFFAIRHILHLTPVLILLAGYGLSHVGERLTILDRPPYRLSAPAILYAGLLAAMSLWIGATHWTKELADWRGTARFLAETARPGDAISVPVVQHLVGYYFSDLEKHRVPDLDPGPGRLGQGSVTRRIVVCYDEMYPDPCRDFRPAASADKSWNKLSLRGFSIFIRTSPARPQ